MFGSTKVVSVGIIGSTQIVCVGSTKAGIDLVLSDIDKESK